MSKRPSVKMSKQELADNLAKALNLLNGLNRDEWTNKELGEYHSLIRCLEGNKDVREDFANNGTLDSRDLI
jgi:hypothetical protein